MCLADVMKKFREYGLSVTPARLYYAIGSGKVSKPEVNGSLSYEFSDANVAELRAYFSAPKKRGRAIATS